MATATPETLGSVFSQIISEAEKQAADQADVLENIFGQLGDLADHVTDLPGNIWDELKSLVDPPKWWSLLLFAMVQVSKIDPDHLKAGAMKPPGWSRMVTLTYTNPPVPPITLGLALVKDVDGGDEQKRGVLIRTAGPIPVTPLENAVSLFKVLITASGAAEWQIPFSGGIEPPDQDGTVDFGFTWDPPDLLAGSDGVTTGVARIAVQLNSAPDKLYKVVVGLGDRADSQKPGLRAVLDLSPKLGVLGEMVKIAKIDERYRPEYSRGTNAAPAFDLNHRSVS